MRMHQLAIADNIAVGVLNVPTIGIVVPPCIGVPQCDIDAPAHAAAFSSCLDDFRKVGPHSGGETDSKQTGNDERYEWDLIMTASIPTLGPGR